jgi:6,7-dimethyl-8-ribityllumazine synthase
MGANELELPDDVASSLVGRVGRVLGGDASGRGLRVGVACSRFNGGVTWRLLSGALAFLEEAGVDRNDVTVAWVPGAFELPLMAQRLATGSAAVDAVICLGAVIRGETGHYDLVAGECAAGIQRVQLDTGVPVAFGVLTTETLDQALARSEPGEANKGREAAHTALEVCRLLRAV